MKKTTRFLVRSAVIAALYAALTLVLSPIAFGPVQFRLSEAFTVLPLFCAEAVPGLTIGCLIANIFSGSVWDMLVGTTATLFAALCTRAVKKVYLGVIPPVVFNAFLVPIVFLTMPSITEPYFISVLTVGLGELLSVVGLGVPLYFGLKKISKRAPFLFDEQNKN